MLDRFKSYVTALAAYLGDAAHRRAVASLIMAVALHFGGVALDIDHIDTLIGLMIPLAAAWSSKTRKIEDNNDKSAT